MEESKMEKNPKKMKPKKKKVSESKPHVMANACDQHLRD